MDSAGDGAGAGGGGGGNAFEAGVFIIAAIFIFSSVIYACLGACAG